MDEPKVTLSPHRPVMHRLGYAWLSFCIGLAAHVTDEAATGFLSVYNPTVIALRQKFGFWPMPTFEFHVWLTGLTFLIITLLTLSPLMFRSVPWVRPFAYF